MKVTVHKDHSPLKPKRIKNPANGGKRGTPSHNYPKSANVVTSSARKCCK